MADASNQNLSSNNSRLSDVDRRQFQRDAYIFREHEQGDRAYIIAKGKVEILKQGPEGPISLRVLQEGAMFGEMALIDDEPRMASAKAVEGAVDLLEIDKKTFKKKLSLADPFTRGLINILADTARNLAKSRIKDA
jgi:CRP-like cAMP-binding protein